MRMNKLEQNLRDIVFSRVLRCIDISVSRDFDLDSSREEEDRINEEMTDKLIDILTNIVNEEDYAKIKMIELFDDGSGDFNEFDAFIRVYFDDESIRLFEIDREDVDFFINNKELIGLTHEEFEDYCNDHDIELNW